MVIRYTPILFIVLSLVSSVVTGAPRATPDLPNFDKQWDYSDPVITELKFLEILAEVDSKQNPGYHLELRTQIARALGLQQRFEEAQALLDEIKDDLLVDYPVAKIRYLLERGRVLNSSVSKEKSKPFFLEAWELGNASNADYYAIDAAHMLGIVEEPAQQLEWNEKALVLAESSADPETKRWIGSLYNNIGWTYHDQQDYEQALFIFTKAQRWRQMNKQVKEIRIADWAVARTHRSLGNIDLALEMQYNLEDEITASGAAEDGYVFEEIGECLLLKGHRDAATSYFQRAWTILSQDPWLQKNEAERLDRLKELGK